MFIETYIIRLLATFSEYGTLTRVGKELGIMQPTISRCMQKLEAELGVPLFDRTENRVAIPLSDPKVNMTFFAVYKKEWAFIYDGLFSQVD